MAAEAGPKAAALLAAAAEPMAQVPLVALKSEGVVLIYGSDERAIEAGHLLEEELDVTVLIKPSAVLGPWGISAFPVARGAIRSVRGYLGAFEVVVDGFAPPAGAPDGTGSCGASHDGAVSHCDILLDLSGGAALFSAPELRDGYVRADPNNAAQLR
jgi:hypothetical protein